MTKALWILPLVLMLTACGGRTKLVPQLYMPDPPELLMKKAEELHTIKQPKEEAQ